MLKAKLDSVRKNKKGFSLVELIIVIAIMVALIAVMAPAFVKYVQKSRDAALATAAEDLEKTIQTFYGDPDCTYDIPDNATIEVKVAANSEGKLVLTLTPDGTKYVAGSGAFKAILDAAGADTGKQMGKTNDKYNITVKKTTDGNASVTMVKGTVS